MLHRKRLPVDVANVEDGPVDAMNLWVSAHELDLDGGETKVGAHGKIGN